jgi:hypothetical protein
MSECAVLQRVGGLARLAEKLRNGDIQCARDGDLRGLAVKRAFTGLDLRDVRLRQAGETGKGFLAYAATASAPCADILPHSLHGRSSPRDGWVGGPTTRPWWPAITYDSTPPGWAAEEGFYQTFLYALRRDVVSDDRRLRRPPFHCST